MMRRFHHVSTSWLPGVIAAALLLSAPAFGASPEPELVPLPVVEAPQTVIVGDEAGNRWDADSLAQPSNAGEARALSISRSEIAEYMVRLELRTEADRAEALALGVPTPHLGTEVYDVRPDVLANLRAAGVPFVMVGGVTEFTVVPAGEAQPQADGERVLAGPVRVDPGEEYSPDVGANVVTEIPNKAAGIHEIGTNTNYSIADQGTRTLQWPVSEGIGAEVTDFEYQIRIADDGSGGFWCSDYEILFTTSQSGAWYLVYNNLGSGTTDGGHDDDAQDDDDIFLNYRSLSSFNGQSMDQTWTVMVRDTIPVGDGVLDYVHLRIYWQTDPVSAGDFAAVDVCGAQPGDGSFSCVPSFSEGSTVVLAFKFTYSGNPVTAQAALALDNASPVATTPTTFQTGNWIFPVNYNNAAVGTHRLRGWCDYYDAVAESNESNNFRDESAAFEVTSGGGGCTYNISPSSVSMPAGGGSGMISVTAGSGCSWTAVSNVGWIGISGGASGSGNGTVNYTVAANSGGSRSGTMTVAGHTFTVTQDGGGGGCTYNISPSTVSMPAGGGSGSVSVTAGSGCSWSAVSNVGWIGVTSGASGTGNGSVGYSVAANSGGSRSGTMTIAGQTFTVTQDGSGGGGNCTPNSTTMCLNSDRFRVQVNWATNQGSSGVGQAVELTDDTGYFWFFNQNNVEMVIKVLDACSANGHYWVFAGGLTNVETQITVTDTDHGTSKTYTNPLNTPFQPIQDTGAFATCP